jgi:D-alanine-D-alanine ligase
MGGISAEREVSLSSGRMCAAALREAGYPVVEVDAGRDLAGVLNKHKPDIAFNALHGRWGEDGCVQGLLEWIGLPYTHSGVLASALTMDKIRAKAVYREAGLPVAESRLAHRAEIEAAHAMAPPYVVKPHNEGSSVGVYLVLEGANRPPQLSPEMPETLMVEAYVPGRELTVSVLDDRALTVTDIVTDGWYDYDAKYKPGGSRHVLPADVPQAIFDACMDSRPHRPPRAWVPRAVAHRFPLGRKPRHRMAGPSGNQHPAGNDAHLALARTGGALRHLVPGLCSRLVEDASCDR